MIPYGGKYFATTSIDWQLGRQPLQQSLVSKQEVKDAVKEVGNSRKKVEAELEAK